MPTLKTISPLTITLQPSRWLQQFNFAIHLLALVASLGNGLPIAVKFGIFALVAWHGWYQHQQLKTENRKIQYTEKHGWQISHGGEFEPVIILPSTALTTFAIFLHCQNKSAMLIAQDALTEEEFRQLLVKLKITANQQMTED